MSFDETIVPHLVYLGFHKNGGSVMRTVRDDIVYGVDLKTEEVFRFDGTERITEDPDDEFLNTTIQAINATLKSKNSDEKLPETGNRNEESSSMESPQDANRQESKHEELPEENSDPIPNKASGLLDLVYDYVGYDVLEVFGDTGSGKSKFGLKVAQDAIEAGKSVFYLDTERNLTEEDIKSLKGCEYKYTPLLKEVDKICQNLPKVDIVVLDSIGFPVLTTFARMSVKEKGDSLLKLIAIFGDLKAWAYKNDGIAVVTNQPESEFNKAPNHIIRPFGDKSQFAAKEIWKTELTKREPNKTVSKITAFRSRSVGHTTKIAEMTITSKGVDIKEVGN